MEEERRARQCCQAREVSVSVAPATSRLAVCDVIVRRARPTASPLIASDGRTRLSRLGPAGRCRSHLSRSLGGGGRQPWPGRGWFRRGCRLVADGDISPRQIPELRSERFLEPAQPRHDRTFALPPIRAARGRGLARHPRYIGLTKIVYNYNRQSPRVNVKFDATRALRGTPWCSPGSRSGPPTR